jgi:hypothetical protein
VDVRIEGSGTPLPVRTLQVAGAIYAIVGAAFLVIGAALGFDELAAIYAYAGPFLLVAGLLGLAATWRRPTGFICGTMALAMMLPLVPVGPPIVAIVVFTGVRSRDRIAEYYGERFRR